MKSSVKNSSTSRRRPLVVWLVAGAVIAAVLTGAYLTFANDDEAKTTSTSKTAQSNYSGGRERPVDRQGSENSQGGAVDNNGEVPTTPDTSPGTTSETGVLTVNNITKDKVLNSGDVLSGSVKDGVEKVHFRIIDENAGVIAQGSLKVVDESFSGTLSFKPQSSSGRLDVYTYNSAGVETNNIEIPIRFK